MEDSTKAHSRHGTVVSKPTWLMATYKGKPFIDELVDSAENILDAHPNADFIGIGQSPAWMCRTAGMMCKRRGVATTIKVLPFSGTHSKKDGQSYEMVDGKLVKSFKVERPNHVHLYRKHLSKTGVCPKTIIRNFSEYGKTTVITDYCKSGGGLASFMHIMCQWANEQGVLDDFLKAVKVHALYDPADGRCFDAMRFEDLGVTIPVTKQAVSTQYAHHFADGDNSSMTDRLVQHYPNSKWLYPPQPITSPDVTSMCGGLIGEAIGAREAKREMQRRAATRLAEMQAAVASSQLNT